MIRAFFATLDRVRRLIAVEISWTDGNLPITLCIAGALPDFYRTEHFGPLVEFELPPSEGTDAEFEAFLEELRQQDEQE